MKVTVRAANGAIYINPVSIEELKVGGLAGTTGKLYIETPTGRQIIISNEYPLDVLDNALRIIYERLDPLRLDYRPRFDIEAVLQASLRECICHELDKRKEEP